MNILKPKNTQFYKSTLSIQSHNSNAKENSEQIKQMEDSVNSTVGAAVYRGDGIRIYGLDAELEKKVLQFKNVIMKV